MSGRARPSRPNPWRSARRAVALGLLLLAAAPAGPARAAEPGASESRGAPTQDGWWNRLQGPPEGEPDGNPVRPLVPAIPKPPNVPDDAIATGAGAGQVDKVAAVGIDLALADGAALDGLTLRLQESPMNGANTGAESAKVIACPATVPWGPGQNAAWRERPAADCSLGSAEGARGADGLWTFDLTGIGRLWADPIAPLAPNGVVLSADPAGSASPVQVSWLNFDSGKVAVELRATPAGPAAGGGPAAPAPVEVAASAPAQSFFDTPTGNRALPAQISADPFAYPSGEPKNALATPAASDTPGSGTTGSGTTGSGSPSESPAEAALAASPGRPGPALGARPVVGLWEHVPAPTVLLLPIAIGLAVLIGVALGPMARPSPVFQREGGLSRALARRSPAGSA